MFFFKYEQIALFFAIIPISFKFFDVCILLISLFKLTIALISLFVFFPLGDIKSVEIVNVFVEHLRFLQMYFSLVKIIKTGLPWIGRS